MLDHLLNNLPRQFDPNLIVGFEKSDDAGIYRINADLALVQTVDFLTPVIDDPFTFGQISAVNALSDVYAMGGRPLTALALVFFPEDGELTILSNIMAGGLSKMIEAGCTILGGHSIQDSEIKFGYSVTGSINPQKVLTNAGANPGDKLILTKALGTGAISTAVRKERAMNPWIQHAVNSMTTLNSVAADVMQAGQFSVHAVTDVTGFGLIGHAREIARASKVQLRLYATDVPVLEGAFECIDCGCIPAGTRANREFAEKDVEYVSDVPDRLKALLFDPQTAGGLLIAVSSSDSDFLLQELQRRGVSSTEIGDVIEGNQYGSAHILIV